MPPVIHEDFDSVAVQLQDINLIEASAGTGKTYSIAILVLRLILEENIPIDKILMVTFTRDAAAEMEIRVRGFIRDALMYARNGEIKDSTIKKIVNDFADNKKLIERLHKALLTFDKASIFTIHGFCARILKEFSFECGQQFRSNAMEPDVLEELTLDAFNQAWREKITTLPTEVFALWIENEYDRSKLLGLVKGHLMGKSIYVPEEMSDAFDLIRECQQTIVDTEKRLREFIEKKVHSWSEKADQLTGTAKTHLAPSLRNRDLNDLFKKIMRGYATTKYIKDHIDSDVLKIAEELDEAQNRLPSLIAASFNQIAIECADYIENSLKDLRAKNGQVTFDDMITELHRAVSRPSTQEGIPNHLVQILRERYAAVFIDEFQDTDKLQYEIFSTIFSEKALKQQSVVFYIGDPKQSIYAFRKADLQTYFRAAKEVDHIYRMNINYRSSENYIHAMNAFFRADDSLDVFYWDQMTYYPVEAPNEKKKTGGLFFENTALAPLRIMGCSTKDIIHEKVVLLVQQLLFAPQFTIRKDQTEARISAGQIGILIRSGTQGKLLRKLLAKKGIPSVIVSDEKIFQSSEANEILQILEAVENITIGNIYRAMLTTIAGFEWHELLKLDKDPLLQQFRTYQELWTNKGVYLFLRQFLTDVELLKRKLEGKIKNADRLLSDVFQLMEILHEAETDKNYTIPEMIYWLKKAIEGEATSEDQYLQRIESDEQAVKIVTIHSAKGLEYDIVIAPFLDMDTIHIIPTTQFYYEGSYYTADKKLLNGTNQSSLRAASELQEKQENMRLLYVALTRAKYHCYIMSADSAKQTSSLQHLLTPFLTLNQPNSYIQTINIDSKNSLFSNHVNQDTNPPELRAMPVITQTPVPHEAYTFTEIPDIQLPDRYWQKTSYSGLNPQHETIIRIRTEAGEDVYDQFIFRQIRSGAQAGNFLHELLERIDFSDNTKWLSKATAMINRYPGIIKTENPEQKILQMLSHIVHTTLQDGQKTFTLNEVSFSSRIQEMEFDMPLTDVDLKRFPESLEGGKVPLRIRKEGGLTGILNGKIDLFFEHGGRYYLLDWKSNHLGNQAEAYHTAALESAMEEHNYYLQYYLYCLAACRYLKQRLPGFDYEKHFGGVYYIFLRGIRSGTSYGIYSHRPALADLIQLDQLLLLQQPQSN